MNGYKNMFGLLAALSGGYALYLAFQNLPAAICFGLLWGAVIFNVDRLIVSAIKKEGGITRQWRQAIPRFLLALMLSVVIAKPLELRIFQPEILEILATQKAEKMRLTEAEFLEKTNKTEESLARLKEETLARFQLRETLYQDYRCECDGTCGDRKSGRGSECKRKEAKYIQADQEFQALKAKNDRLIASARAAMDNIKKEEIIALHQVDITQATGLQARLSASGNLPFLPGFFITLLIFFVGIDPVLLKILAPRGSYEEALK